MTGLLVVFVICFFFEWAKNCIFHTCYKNSYEITDSGLKLLIYWREKGGKIVF